MLINVEQSLKMGFKSVINTFEGLDMTKAFRWFMRCVIKEPQKVYNFLSSIIPQKESIK